ncbi:MAG: hypothetical protein C0609_05390 [Deltaproteobacteria bacterium]|nr:MAG: hypothetical protein C0609_05390 [Deltaproteobacteria bacterium]
MSEAGLKEIILSEIRKEGPINFERYINYALYHAEFGYYFAGNVSIGGDRADFITSPHVSKIFSRCLANFILLADKALSSPEVLWVVEGGPGEGELARTILDTISARDPDLYSRLRYVTDEVSPALKERQKRLLSPHSERLAKEPPKGFEGVYLSNELIDAISFNVFLNRDGAVSEIYVTEEDGELIELEGAVSSPLPEGFVPGKGVFRFEHAPGVAEWLTRTAERLGRGYILTIDYGDERGRLFGPQRERGTARGFSRHTHIEGLLDAPGECDLTRSVDFTELIDTGSALGLTAEPLFNQRQLLYGLGMVEEVQLLEEESADEVEALARRHELAPLLLGGVGMGETFKGLLQVKGAPAGIIKRL